MTVTTVGKLGERIIEVKRIVNYAKALPADQRKTIKEIYSALKANITSEGQVGSTLQYYHKKGDLSRMREGQSHYYWGKGAVSASPTGLSPSLEIEAAAPIEKKESWIMPEISARIDKAITMSRELSKPEIRVEKDHIIIEHAKCRIIVELL